MPGSPAWLRSLMEAWADGLNYYLATHPDVHPKVLTRFEPWMALSFTEGSIGGDIERISLSELESLYGKRQVAMTDEELGRVLREPRGSTASPSRRSNTADGHALLLINPHTSFYFRSELQMTSGRGAQHLWRLDLGPVLHLSGLQRQCRLDAYLVAASTMSTSSPRPSSTRSGKLSYRYGDEAAPGRAQPDLDRLSPAGRQHGHAQLHRSAHPSRPDSARSATANGSPPR